MASLAGGRDPARGDTRGRKAGAPLTILLIDDSASVREVLRVALESEGFRVLEARDGRGGVRLCCEQRPAPVIVDIVMPEKDGLETVKRMGLHSALRSKRFSTRMPFDHLALHR